MPSKHEVSALLPGQSAKTPSAKRTSVMIIIQIPFETFIDMKYRG